MKILIISMLAASLVFSTSALAAPPDTADLEKRLQQQERRIDRLERAVEVLQDSLMDAQYAEPANVVKEGNIIIKDVVGAFPGTDQRIEGIEVRGPGIAGIGRFSVL